MTSAVLASAGKNASIASSESVTSRGVPKTVVVEMNDRTVSSATRRSRGTTRAADRASDTIPSATSSYGCAGSTTPAATR